MSPKIQNNQGCFNLLMLPKGTSPVFTWKFLTNWMNRIPGQAQTSSRKGHILSTCLRQVGPAEQSQYQVLNAEARLLGYSSVIKMWDSVWPFPFLPRLVLERLCFLYTKVHELMDLTDVKHQHHGLLFWMRHERIGQSWAAVFWGKAGGQRHEGSRSSSLAWQGYFKLSKSRTC